MVYQAADYLNRTVAIPEDAAGLSNAVIVQATAPGSPVVGQRWRDTSMTPNLLKVWDSAAWIVPLDQENLDRMEQGIADAHDGLVYENAWGQDGDLVAPDAGDAWVPIRGAQQLIEVVATTHVAVPSGQTIVVQVQNRSATSLGQATIAAAAKRGSSGALTTSLADGSDISAHVISGPAGGLVGANLVVVAYRRPV